MADYFESEEIVKGYDGAIFKRILSYLGPYKGLVLLVAFALAASTLGDLVVPIIAQRVIDNALVTRFLVIRTNAGRAGLSAAAESSLEELLEAAGTRKIGNLAFAPQGQNSSLTGRVEEELADAGVLDQERWYAFSPGEEAGAVMDRYPGRFIREGDAAAIKNADLEALSRAEIRALRSGDLSYLTRMVIIALVILALVFVFTFIQTWTTDYIGQLVMKDMRLELFRKTASQSTDFLSRHPVGRIVTRLTGDVETINEFFTSVLVAFLKDLSVMAGVLVVLFVLSPKLALVVLLTLPPVLVATSISRVKSRDAFRRQRAASSKVNSYLSERLSGVQVVQLFRGEQKSRREFGERNQELLDASLKEMYVFATFRPLVDWFATITTSAVIVVGAMLVLDLSVSLGVLFAFISLVGMFYAPVQDIAEKYTMLQSAMAGGERVFKLLDTEEAIPNTGKRPFEDTVRGHIEFDDVHFSYKKGEEILKGLSFRVNPGEMAAIVGYTGAGKTTITNVLARLWDLDSGEIRLDGVPIKEIPLDELRRSALPVLQDVFLFSGTVAENISLGLPLTGDQVEEAARAVHAHEFISRLPEGYRTKLSEGATNISSGQRQLISFARVIAHNPAIVILDEATSSIDTETEHLIQLGMQRVLAGRTSIVIAHRLSTIRHADRILVLSGGRLVEQGRHDELISRGGLYATLYRLQYEGGIEE
ncbi:MAG: ABC transporter ATP-binding protein/permease [Treponema sp.]|jgi:ATP-binding cassette subfamily B protein|nr:ABC transporter ATP-binding protein/permease [Treponema sp.]